MTRALISGFCGGGDDEGDEEEEKDDVMEEPKLTGAVLGKLA
jgi:hypothetical protein